MDFHNKGFAKRRAQCRSVTVGVVSWAFTHTAGIAGRQPVVLSRAKWLPRGAHLSLRALPMSGLASPIGLWPELCRTTGYFYFPQYHWHLRQILCRKQIWWEATAACCRVYQGELTLGPGLCPMPALYGTRLISKGRDSPTGSAVVPRAWVQPSVHWTVSH